MRVLLALTLAAAACTGDPPAPSADAAPDSAPDAADAPLEAAEDAVAVADAAPDAREPADASPPPMDAIAVADAGPDAPSIDAGDAPADADASCETRCDGACVDTGFDPLNCGACGVRCSAGAPHTRAQCFGGRCEMPCEDGYQSCNSSLADGCETYVLGSDRNNCGSCRGTCSPSAICVAGRCRTP